MKKKILTKKKDYFANRKMVFLSTSGRLSWPTVFFNFEQKLYEIGKSYLIFS